MTASRATHWTELRLKLLLCALCATLITACSGLQLRRGEGVPVVTAAISPTYQTQIFQLDADGLPIASVPGDHDDLWVVSEFGNSLKHVSSGPPVAIEPLAIPISVTDGSWPFVGDRGGRTNSPHSERIVRDNQGRLWFAQNGSWFNAYLTQGISNHSRIVSYDPRNQEFCVYPVPDNNAGVMGVAWDDARNLVWFSQSGNNALVAFNPDDLRDCKTYNRYRWQLDDKGQFIDEFPIQYCTWSGETACFRKYVLPLSQLPLINQIAVQQPGQPDAGAVWITEYTGGHIGRFEISTGDYQRFPIDVDRDAYNAMGLNAGFYHRTHHILIHPHTGDLAFSTNGTGQVFRFDILHYLNNPAACLTLDAEGYNPCMSPIQVPVYRANKGGSTTHSLSFDRFGNLWVTTWLKKCPSDAPPPGIGFVDSNWERLVYFDPTEQTSLGEGSEKSDRPTIECAENGWPPWGFMGISVDAANNVWFANFFGRHIHKWTYAGSQDQNPFDLLCDQTCRTTVQGKKKGLRFLVSP